LAGCVGLPAGAAELAGGVLDTVSGGIGVPRVTAGLGSGVAEGFAGGDEDGNCVVGAGAGAAASGLALGPTMDGGASGRAVPLGREPAVPAGVLGLTLMASAPPGGVVEFALGNSTLGTLGHPSATPGGWPLSALLRANDT
jgi:hypothetical protein